MFTSDTICGHKAPEQRGPQHGPRTLGSHVHQPLHQPNLNTGIGNFMVLASNSNTQLAKPSLIG